MSVKRRPDGKWRARVRVDGVEKAQHFTAKVDAENWERAQRTAVARGEFIDPAGARKTFKDVAEDWQETRVWRPATRALVERHFKNHVYPEIGHRPIGALRSSEIQGLVKKLDDKLAAATVTVIMRFVSGVFKSAVIDRRIASSPCIGITLPKRQPKRIVPLTREQLVALEEAMPARLAALVTVGAGLGLRQGEAFGLTVDRVDFLRRRVEIDRQVVTPPTGDPAFGPLKTESSARFVPLPSVVADRLARHIEEHGTGRDGLLFTTPDGAPLRRNRFGEPWHVAVKAANVEPGTGYHALRHSYASALISAGVSVRAVAANLGHADPGITLRTYAHLMPDDADRSRDAVDALYRADQTRTSSGLAV